jgi:hypothetical protein
MQGLLETPGLTVAGHLGLGQVNEAPTIAGAFILSHDAIVNGAMNKFGTCSQKLVVQ